MMLSKKICDAIKEEAEIHPEETWTSIEFFPPKTPAGVTNLYALADKLKADNPLFADVTWGAGGSTSDLTMEICEKLKQQGLNPNMHLTCTNMERQKVFDALAGCKKLGITNIVALRGDPPAGQEAWAAVEGGFTCALDLVKYIKQEHQDYFCISVAGYPEGHPTAMTTIDDPSTLTPSELGRCAKIEVDGKQKWSVCLDKDFEKELDYLKQKVNAGADCIITQLFFDVEVFVTFVNKCREKGINVPILPGIMCLGSAGGFKRMIGFCKTRVPEALEAAVELVTDDAQMRELGIAFGTEMCEKLLKSGSCSGLHFYTLNASLVTKGIISNLRKTRKMRGLAPQNAENEKTVFDTLVQNAAA